MGYVKLECQAFDAPPELGGSVGSQSPVDAEGWSVMVKSNPGYVRKSTELSSAGHFFHLLSLGHDLHQPLKLAHIFGETILGCRIDRVVHQAGRMLTSPLQIRYDRSLCRRFIHDALTARNAQGSSFDGKTISVLRS